MDILYDRILADKKHFIKAAGLSTETPPASGIASGSQYFQVDAGIVQMFDSKEGYWHNFAQFDTGSSGSTSASLGGGLGGSLGGGLGGSNPGGSEEETEPGEGDE